MGVLVAVLTWLGHWGWHWLPGPSPPQHKSGLSRYSKWAEWGRAKGSANLTSSFPSVKPSMDAALYPSPAQESPNW